MRAAGRGEGAGGGSGLEVLGSSTPFCAGKAFSQQVDTFLPMVWEVNMCNGFRVMTPRLLRLVPRLQNEGFVTAQRKVHHDGGEVTFFSHGQKITVGGKRCGMFY